MCDHSLFRMMQCTKTIFENFLQQTKIFDNIFVYYFKKIMQCTKNIVELLFQFFLTSAPKR